MNHIRTCSYLILAFLLLFGCASSKTLGRVPTDMQDFKLSDNEIKEKFPEISNYNKKETEATLTHCATFDQLVALWGPPDETKNNWLRFHVPAFGAVAVGSIAGGGVVGATVGTGIVLGMVPAPFQTYTWHKGNYTINADSDLTIFCGYKRRLISWEWIPDSDQAEEQQ